MGQWNRKMGLLMVVAAFIAVRSVHAVLWGDRMESKMDVMDRELSMLDAAVNHGTTFLTSDDIVNGKIEVVNSRNYALADSLTTDITIAADCVTLDLNDLCLTGTITVLGSFDVTIKNGTLLPPAGAKGGGAIFIGIDSDKTRISNLTIKGEASVAPGGAPGKDGIEIAGSNWVIENCTIITGAGTGANNRGGHGISLLATAHHIVIHNCLISTGNGGTDALGGGDGGNGINVDGSTDIEIADCTIFKTGTGGNGGVMNGDGGNGVFITNDSTDISVHNCIIRNTGVAGAGLGGAGVAGKAIEDEVVAGATVGSIIFGNFAHNIAHTIRFDLQAAGIESGFALSNPPNSTAVSVYANVYM